MDLGLKDRVAIVAASSQGLGKAVAMGLAREGAKLSLCARTEATLQATAEEIRAGTGGDEASIFAGDHSLPAAGLPGESGASVPRRFALQLRNACRWLLCRKCSVVEF